MMLKIMLWFTRILAILAIAFIMMFSLDVFGGGDPLTKQILAFLIHNIPAFGLILALVVSWKYEIFGGVIFILLFIGLGIFWGSFKGNSGSLVLIVPFLIIGILLILHQILAISRRE